MNKLSVIRDFVRNATNAIAFIKGERKFHRIWINGVLLDNSIKYNPEDLINDVYDFCDLDKSKECIDFIYRLLDGIDFTGISEIDIYGDDTKLDLYISTFDLCSDFANLFVQFTELTGYKRNTDSIFLNSLRDNSLIWYNSDLCYKQDRKKHVNVNYEKKSSKEKLASIIGYTEIKKAVCEWIDKSDADKDIIAGRLKNYISQHSSSVDFIAIALYFRESKYLRSEYKDKLNKTEWVYTFASAIGKHISESYRKNLNKANRTNKDGKEINIERYKEIEKIFDEYMK